MQKYKDLEGEVTRKDGIILLRELASEVKNFMDFKMNAVMVSFAHFLFELDDDHAPLRHLCARGLVSSSTKHPVFFCCLTLSPLAKVLRAREQETHHLSVAGG